MDGCEACIGIGEEPSMEGTSCECREGYENFGRIRALLGDEGPPLAAFGARVDECKRCDPTKSLVWKRLVCPGGPKQGPPKTGHAYNVILARPRVGYWMSSLHGTEGGPNRDVFTTQDTTAWSEMDGHDWLLEEEEDGTKGELTLNDFVYSCPPTACVGEQSLTGCFENDQGTGNTGLMCGQCMYRGELDVHRHNTVKVGGKCYDRCGGYSPLVRYWVRFVVQYTVLGLVLKLNGGMLDVHVDGATINHLTFFFQTWQLLGKFGDADMYGIDLLLKHNGESDTGDITGSLGGDLTDDSMCDWTFDMYGSFYVMVGAVPLFMWSFSLMLWYFDNRKKEKLALDAINRIYNPAAARAAPKSDQKSCLMKIGPINEKITESRSASRLDFFVDPTRLLTNGSAEDGKFNTEGLWWLMACLKLQQGMRTITLNRTIVEISMFCYMKVAMVSFPMLLCREVTSVIDGETITRSLSVTDLGVECAGALFWTTRTIALFLFVGFVLGFPVMLARITKIERDSDSDDPSSKDEQRKIPPKFDSFCRVSNIFDGEHRYW